MSETKPETSESKSAVSPELWNQVKSNLKAKNCDNKFMQTWFDPTRLLAVEPSVKGPRFRLGVPTDLHKYWISENFFDRICAEISAVYRRPFQVELVVTGDPLPTNDLIYRDAIILSPPPGETPRDHKAYARHEVLNSDYTFSTFVVGRNNEFVHAASFYIAQHPGAEGYNPLFILGPTGMGKTHLLNAIGNQIRSRLTATKINYLSAERFLNECIASIRRNEMDKFRSRYRDKCDILLMDDIQILGRTEAVQEEFFHTLNDFFEKGRQVVVASDRMPKEIHGLEDRIRTRLEWGLIADIQMPDIETRIAILRYKAEKKGLILSDEVISYIAKISRRSIRELEGNLNKVKMFTELRGVAITHCLAKEILVTHDDATTLTVEDIQKLVSEHFKVRLIDIKSKGRAQPLVTARQVAMFLIKKYLNKSLQDIGRYFGGKDHTTVISSLRKINYQLTRNADLKRDIEELERQIQISTGV